MTDKPRRGISLGDRPLAAEEAYAQATSIALGGRIELLLNGTPVLVEKAVVSLITHGVPPPEPWMVYTTGGASWPWSAATSDGVSWSQSDRYPRTHAIEVVMSAEDYRRHARGVDTIRHEGIDYLVIGSSPAAFVSREGRVRITWHAQMEAA